MVLKDAQVLKPKAHEYVILVTWHREIKVADGIKVANQLIGTSWEECHRASRGHNVFTGSSRVVEGRRRIELLDRIYQGFNSMT